MHAPLISVIMPAFNEEGRITRAIESVQAQTLGAWELLIADDGSRDGTLSIAHAAAARDGRIRVLALTNGGVSKARNAALAAATGDLIVFHDSDDWLDPRHFAMLAGDLASRPDAAVAACAYAAAAEDGAVLQTHQTPALPDPFLAFSRTCAFPIHAAMVRRQIVLDVGAFDETLHGGEDWDLWLRIARTGSAFCVRPDVLAFYRQRAGSTTRDAALMIRALIDVVPRAFRADPRVRSAALHYADGAPACDLRDALMEPVFYNIGVAVAAGQSVDAIWPLLPDLDGWQFDAARTAHAIVAGMRYAGASLDGHAILDRLRTAFSGLAKAQGQARDADLLCAHVEARMRGRNAFDRIFASEWVQTGCVDVVSPKPPVLDENGPPCTVLALHGHGEPLGALEMPTALAIQPDAFAAALAACAREWPSGRGAWRAALQNPIGAATVAASRLRGHRPGRARLLEATAAAIARARAAGFSDPPERASTRRDKGAACTIVPIFMAEGPQAASLAAHIDTLGAAGFEPIAMDDWTNALRSGIAPRGQRFAVGIRGEDVDDQILAVLAARNVPATVFLSLDGDALAAPWTWAKARAGATRGVRFGWRVAISGVSAAALARAKSVRTLLADTLHQPTVCAMIGPGESSRSQAEILRAAGFAGVVGRKIGRSHIDEPVMDMRRAPINALMPSGMITALAQTL